MTGTPELPRVAVGQCTAHRHLWGYELRCQQRRGHRGGHYRHVNTPQGPVNIVWTSPRRVT